MPSKHNPINGVIYKTINLVNGMWYIGKDERNNPMYLGSGIYLSRAIAKYGKESFIKEILDKATTPTELALLEVKYIEKYNATNNAMSYNIAAGGTGGNTLVGMSDSDRLKFSAKMSEVWNNLTVEIKGNRISAMNAAVRNKPKTQAHRDKISKSKTGVKQDSATIEKKVLISKQLYIDGRISPPKNDWTGKNHTNESKLKISKSKTGVKNVKKRLFSAADQAQMRRLKEEGVRTGVIADMYCTTGSTILRYIREPVL